MVYRVIICLFLSLLTGCAGSGLISDPLREECVRSLENQLAESTVTYDYVKDSKAWYYLSDSEIKELFERANAEDCWKTEIPVHKKYKVGLRKHGEDRFEVDILSE